MLSDYITPEERTRSGFVASHWEQDCAVPECDMCGEYWGQDIKKP